jgi:ABC-type sugar transport system ATPase subunit
VDAVALGMALVPDDRKAKGLVLEAGLAANLGLTSRRGFWIHRREERDAATRIAAELRLRTADLDGPAGHLSGGNQQKAVLAKWLLAGARIFLLDEPTRGIDVRAKAEVHALVSALAARGAAVLVASSEAAELRELAGRILVMHRGRIAGELPAAEATDERIVHLATGGSQARA